MPSKRQVNVVPITSAPPFPRPSSQQLLCVGAISSPCSCPVPPAGGNSPCQVCRGGRGKEGRGRGREGGEGEGRRGRGGGREGEGRRKRGRGRGRGRGGGRGGKGKEERERERERYLVPVNLHIAVISHSCISVWLPLLVMGRGAL